MAPRRSIPTPGSRSRRGRRSGAVRWGPRAPVAQWTERGRPKACVGGSSPSGGARIRVWSTLTSMAESNRGRRTGRGSDASHRRVEECCPSGVASGRSRCMCERQRLEPTSSRYHGAAGDGARALVRAAVGRGAYHRSGRLPVHASVACGPAHYAVALRVRRLGWSDQGRPRRQVHRLREHPRRRPLRLRLSDDAHRELARSENRSPVSRMAWL